MSQRTEQGRIQENRVNSPDAQKAQQILSQIKGCIFDRVVLINNYLVVNSYNNGDGSPWPIVGQKNSNWCHCEWLHVDEEGMESHWAGLFYVQALSTDTNPLD